MARDNRWVLEGRGIPASKGRRHERRRSHLDGVVIPLAVKPRGGRKAIISPGVLDVESRHDITLIKAVARAFRWLRMLESGRFATITELAAAEKINASYVSRILRLTLLAPDVVEAILDGRQPEGKRLVFTV